MQDLTMPFEYHNSSLNLSDQNLQSYSFKGQNFSGANFSGSDIRGADFTGAILTNANFSNAKAGLRKYWLIVSFLFSLLSGFLAGAIAVVICASLYSSDSDDLIASAIALTGCIAFLIVSLQEGFANAFTKILGILAFIGTLAGIISVAFSQKVLGNIAISTANNLVLNVSVVVVITIFLAFTIANTNNNAVISSLIISVFTTISIPLLSTGIAATIAQNGWFAITITTGIAVLIMLLCADISRRTLAGDENHTFIRRIVLATVAIGGTSFRGANLTGVNFTGAILRNTDFTKANLTHTIWYQSKKLELARLDKTILDNLAVLDLLVNKNYHNKSYENACLEGAYLVDLDLRGVDFKNANLIEANLTGANLTKADFTDAKLTKANLQGRSCILFRYSRNTSLDGVYLDIYQALQKQLHQDIAENIEEYQLQNLPVEAWVNEVRLDSFKKVINEAFLQQLALEVQKYQPLTKQWQYAFQTLTNAILLSDKLLHKANIYDDVYEEAKNELWIWLYQNINTYNPSKGKFTAWLNFRFDMILRNSQAAKKDPFIQQLNAKIIRTKYQLINIIKNINRENLFFWLTLQIKQLVPYVLGVKILFLFTVIFLISQLMVKKPVAANSLLFVIAKQSLPTAAILTNIDDEIENIPQIEVEKSLLEQLREYLETNPNQLLQKHIRRHPEVTFQVIALKRLEGIGWKELSETFSIGIPALSNFFQRHLQKIAPEIKKNIQE